MRTNIYLFASLTLGLFVASCQNGLEEVIDESAVQNEQAATRADEEENSAAEDEEIYDVTIVPVTETEDDMLEIMATYTSGPTINGSSIIGRYETVNYSFASVPVGTDHFAWSYDTSRFSGVTSGKNLYLTLTDETSTVDITLYLYFYDSSNNILAVSSKPLGVNGPRLNSSTVRILRSSDGVEAYPSTAVRLEPNTYYYGYFNGLSSVFLTDWDFNGHATWINEPSYPVHFLTDSQGWCFLDVYGYMSSYGVVKKLVSVTLYGQ